MSKNASKLFEATNTRIDIQNTSDEGILNFVQLFIGLVCFANNERLMRIDKQTFINETIELRFKENKEIINQSYTQRYKIESNDLNRRRYVLFSNPNKELICIDNCVKGDYSNEYFVRRIHRIVDYERIVYATEASCFGSIGAMTEIIDLLIDVAHDNYRKEDGSKKIWILRELYDNLEKKYRFILGSGVNYGFGMLKWEELSKNFSSEINNIFKVDVCDELVKETFNANYGVFQILKDLDRNKYFNVLEDLVSPKVEDLSSGKTMNMIIDVLNYQKSKMSKQNILTFNYDSLVEKFLSYSKTKSVFKKDENADGVINVIHSHGFLPYENRKLKGEDYYDTIVLTTGEYFENYKGPSSFGYKKLYEHLDETCFFVGNSISDYEEQKVISDHFKAHPSQFHFAFFSRDIKYKDEDKMKEDEKENYRKEILAKEKAILYKTVFLLKIGIIPLWYDSHDAYADEIMAYISGR